MAPAVTASNAPRRRAVLLVANAASPYSRALRVARSLAAAGWDVEIAAVAEGDHPREERDPREPSVVTRRYVPRGRWIASIRGRQEPARGLDRWIIAGFRRAARLVPPFRRLPAPTSATIRKIVYWPVHVRAWWEALRTELPPADLYHAFGILTIPVALELAAAARRTGGRPRVVYDVIDVILDSNNYSDVPRPILAFYKWRERRWVRRADAIVTVNEPIADHLGKAWHLRQRPTVLLNCQPRWDVPRPRPDHIRAATGIPASRRVVLWLGRLGRERGLHEAAEAVLRLHDAALVMLGWGPWADELRARDHDPRYAGRHFTLPPVHPDDVPAWTASADVSVIAVPANSLNQRLSTPNKFWESLTAGTPVVLGRDLEVMREILEADDLGRTADPSSSEDLARALAEILEQSPASLEAMKERCLAVTRDRYNWEAAVVGYLQLTARLVPAASSGGLSSEPPARGSLVAEGTEDA